MKVLVMGAKGFVGHHVVDALLRRGDEVFAADRTTDLATVQEWARSSDAIVHLAGANRPETEAEFTEVNRDLIAQIVEGLGDARPFVVFSSSTQAELNNPYGASKRGGEEVLEGYGNAVILRLPNVFGKESRPFYNTVVATFCHNVARGELCTVSDPTREVTFVYIDDVVATIIASLENPPKGVEYRTVPTEYKRSLGQLLSEIESFREMRTSLKIPDLSDRFLVSLYATYLSFLPQDDFAYSLLKREDERGSLAEFVKSPNFGQIFVSRTHPGITRGNHFHQTKTEKFLVLEGEAVVRFRHVHSDEVLEYPVKGEDYRVVDIPPGYTHSIENVGQTELVTLFWASEIFDPERMDTVFEAVKK